MPLPFFVRFGKQTQAHSGKSQEKVIIFRFCTIFLTRRVPPRNTRKRRVTLRTSSAQKQ